MTIAHLNQMKQDHNSLVASVTRLQAIDPTYELDGFDFDFNQWLANLDAQNNSVANVDDMADAFFAQATGIPMF